MGMSTYDQGSLVHLVAVFAVSGVATDPGVVTLTIQKPDGTQTTPTVTRNSTGNYSADIDTTAGPVGVWQYWFSGTSPVQAVQDSGFILKKP